MPPHRLYPLLSVCAWDMCVEREQSEESECQESQLRLTVAESPAGLAVHGRFCVHVSVRVCACMPPLYHMGL